MLNVLKNMAWIARNKNNILVIFNDKPASDGCDYYVEEQVKSEDFTDLGVELPSDADFRLLGRSITYADGAIELK